MENKSKFK